MVDLTITPLMDTLFELDNFEKISRLGQQRRSQLADRGLLDKPIEDLTEEEEAEVISILKGEPDDSL